MCSLWRFAGLQLVYHSYQTMFSDCRIKVLGIVFQCSDTHFLCYKNIQHLFILCFSMFLLCWAVEWQKTVFIASFSAQLQNISNEMTLVANESIILYYVLSLVVDGGGLKLMQFKMVSSRNLFLQAVLHGICCKSSSTEVL